MEKQILEKLIDDGYSQRQIAEELNCSQSNVKYWLKKHLIKTNKNVCNVRTDNEKYCPKCDTKKPLTEFYQRTDRNDVGGYCKKCSNHYHKERVKQVKLKMIEFKGGVCEHCTLKLEQLHYSVFEFHHINPKLKDPNFEHIKYQKWSVIEKELNKCIMLCSNCHRMEHARIAGW